MRPHVRITVGAGSLDPFKIRSVKIRSVKIRSAVIGNLGIGRSGNRDLEQAGAGGGGPNRERVWTA
jgi:hypothetical protein